MALDDDGPRTVDAALALLRSLRADIRDVLATSSLAVTLNRLDVLNPRTMKSEPPDEAEHVWGRVLYVAPEETRELVRISNLVHTTFKRAGYLTDMRPLKLHCTVLNVSKRRPAHTRGKPFSYTDILNTPSALALLNAGDDTASSVSIDLGCAVSVDEIGLWVMGSYGQDGEYVSCGGVSLAV